MFRNLSMIRKVELLVVSAAFFLAGVTGLSVLTSLDAQALEASGQIVTRGDLLWNMVVGLTVTSSAMIAYMSTVIRRDLTKPAEQESAEPAAVQLKEAA